MSEVANFEAVGSIRAVEHLLQSDRVGIAVAVAQTIAVCNAIAHTSDAQRTLGSLLLAAAPCRRNREAEQHTKKIGKKVFRFHNRHLCFQGTKLSV